MSSGNNWGKHEPHLVELLDEMCIFTFLCTVCRAVNHSSYFAYSCVMHYFKNDLTNELTIEDTNHGTAYLLNGAITCIIA